MNEKTPYTQTQTAMAEARAMARNRVSEPVEATADVEPLSHFTKPAHPCWEAIPSRARTAAQAVGSAGLFVDAKNEAAAHFYQRYGFTPCADQPLKLFLSLW